MLRIVRTRATTGKVWLLMGEGYTLPMAAFYTRDDAERYRNKCLFWITNGRMTLRGA